MYEFDPAKQQVSINGKIYNKKNHKVEEQLEGINGLQDFFNAWFSSIPEIEVTTSGSTGSPKKLFVQKSCMIQSAYMTCSFLGLQPGDAALLCLPLQYISGKMMLVRALVAGLDITISPFPAHPLKEIFQNITFSAMVPLQVFNSIQSFEEKKQLANIKNLLIGGGFIDKDLEQKISTIPHNKIYATYGMTETLSHIALRRLNGSEKSSQYTPFPSVKLSLSKQQTLIIEAPLVCEQVLHTNDIVELYEDKSFTVLGRLDNIINTGGIKVQIEEVEMALAQVIQKIFAITSLPDPAYGEIIVLLTTTPVNPDSLREVLPKYHMPKHIFTVDSLPASSNGKLQRKEIKKLAQEYANTEKNKRLNE